MPMLDIKVTLPFISDFDTTILVVISNPVSVDRSSPTDLFIGSTSQVVDVVTMNFYFSTTNLSRNFVSGPHPSVSSPLVLVLRGVVNSVAEKVGI